jgi:predicted RNase H-like HicB family nuclease
MKTSKHRYEIILHWSNEDEAYIAEVPELEWCAADGRTYQEAIENVEAIIDEVDRDGGRERLEGPRTEGPAPGLRLADPRLRRTPSL